MTETPTDTGMGSDIPPTSTRSTRRTRRLAIIGALALVLVAGVVVIGLRAEGSRSGALSSTATKVSARITCVTGYNIQNGSLYYTDRYIVLYFPTGTPAGSVFTAYERFGMSPNFTYSTGRASGAITAVQAQVSFSIPTVRYPGGQTFVVTWSPNSSGEDTLFSEIYCPKP
jgi:hypothetical protein